MLNQSHGLKHRRTDQRDSNFTTAGQLRRAQQWRCGRRRGPVGGKGYVRFFSAKPIREALARMILLQPKMPTTKAKTLATRYRWIDGDIGDKSVVAVIIDAPNFRLAAPLEQALRGVTTRDTKNDVILSARRNAQLPDSVEQATPDQTGTKFISSALWKGNLSVPENESVRLFVRSVTR